MIAIKNIGTQEFISLEYGCFLWSYIKKHFTNPEI